MSSPEKSRLVGSDKLDSLDRLSGANRFKEALEGLEVAFLKELDWRLMLKMLVGRVEEMRAIFLLPAHSSTMPTQTRTSDEVPAAGGACERFSR